MKVSLLAAAGVSACLLVACGGGGGATRADPPPQAPPPTPPPATPPVVDAPDPDFSHHLTWTGADVAHAAGLTGAGVRIGIVDSGVNRSHPAMRDGRVVANLTYINPNTNNLAVDDVVGHGTAVAQIAAGMPFGVWPGGIAPGAQIVSARIISDTPPEDDGSGQGNEVDGALGLAPIHQDLIDRGVRVMNNSWGGLYWTNPAATAPIAAEYRPFIVEHGGLVVFSAGNSGFADPSDTAALPSQTGTGGSLPAADLERGWLTVAALDADNSGQLAAYSNACGVAMHYCLVAPGTIVATGTNDAPDAPSYYQWSGTSFAAPIVSGAAALVWEAFPYFDNDLVRQTLLGTAADLGAPGVDAVYGHGAVNIAAAVNGPSRLDWGDLQVDFDDITSVWRNPLSGDGALIKRGTGMLLLEGRTIGNRGGLQVLEGRLATNGDITGNVLVGVSGTFVPGYGEYVPGTMSPAPGLRIGGSLDNFGWVELRGLEGSPANPGVISQTRIEGDYRHRERATLALELGRQLSVAGSVVLEGGNLHVLGTMPGYTATSRETLIFSSGGIEGSFDALSWDGNLFLDAELQYSPSLVDLFIRRMDVSAVARTLRRMTPASLSAADRIESAFRAIDAGVDPGDAVEFRRIAGEFQQIGDEAAAVAALDSLSGESHARATSLAFDTIDMGRRALSTQFGAAASGDDIRVWKQALGRGGETGFAGGDHALDGWLLGREHALGQTVAGFAFGEAHADDRVGWGGERSRERQAMAQLYAGRRFGDGYALAQAGTGRFDRTIERSLFAGDAGRSGIFSHYAGDYATVGVEAGRNYALAGLRLTPYVGAERTRLRSDAFEEVGGSGFGLRAEGGELRRTQAVAGVRSALDWRGATLHAHGEWQQTLAADGFDIQASFIGIDSWSPLPLADAAKSGGLFGFGLDAPLTRRSTLLLGFDQRFGPRGDERMGSVRYVVGF